MSHSTNVTSHPTSPLPCFCPHCSLSLSSNNFLDLVLQASLLHISITPFSVSVKPMGDFSVHCQDGPQFIIHSSPEGLTGCLQVLTNINNCYKHCVKVSVWAQFLFSFGQTPRSVIAGSRAESMFSSVRSC